MLKKLIISVLIIGAYFLTVGQNIDGVNARLDGMAGIGVISDIGWTVDKPSALYAFPDQVQASGIVKDIENLGTGYGAIIAIKSFGEHTFFGLTFNNRRAMPGGFYNLADGFGEFSEHFNSGVGRFFPDIPHINLGFKFSDNFTGGIGTYMEASKRDIKNKGEFTYSYNNGASTNTLAYDTSVFSKYFGIGFSVDARIWTGPVKINPEFRIYMPKLERTKESNIVDKIKATNHDLSQDGVILQESDNGGTTDLSENRYIRAGSKVSGTIQESLFWIVGYWYKSVKYRLERNRYYDSVVTSTSGPDVYSDTPLKDEQKSWNSVTTYNDLWIGLQPLFDDDLVLGLEYSGSIIKYKPVHEESTLDSTRYYMRHVFRFGTEKSVKGFWCFEEVCPRFGLKYTLFGEAFKYNNNEDVQVPWSTNFSPGDAENGKGLKVTAGFGLKGKRSTFDISLDVLEWKYTTITGPHAAIASWTLNFGKNE